MLATDYRELAPPPALATFVDRLWVQRIGPGEGTFTQPVLPDGAIDVVDLGTRLVVAGPATGTKTLTLTPGEVTVGARFRPGAAPGLVGVSSAELRDRDVAVADLWGPAGATVAARSGEAVATGSWQARLRVVVRGLVDRLVDARAPDPVGLGITALLAGQPGRPLRAIAEDVGLSDRQLRRRVEDSVGLAPRTLARIVRFQRFLDAARAAGPGRHLARLAADAGYADQAHLTRESRDLTGLPPAALLTWEAERLGEQ
jgi:AraC-like DNA-binding protein